MDNPWHVHPKAKSVVCDAKGNTVCTTMTSSELQKNWEKNAKSIVRDHNTHGELLKLAKELHRYSTWEGKAGDTTELAYTEAEVQEIFTKAEEK